LRKSTEPTTRADQPMPNAKSAVMARLKSRLLKSDNVMMGAGCRLHRHTNAMKMLAAKPRRPSACADNPLRLPATT
jgi:hypothetical protein